MRSGIDCKGRKWDEIPIGRAKDITNCKYERLTAKFRVKGDFIISGNAAAHWLCECDCGNEVVESATELRYGKISSCGCFKKEKMSRENSADLIGKVFGYLTVEGRVGSDKNKKALWNCKCICNNYVVKNTGDLVSGHIKSCGCLRIETNRKRNWEDLSGQKFTHLLVKNRNFNYTNDVIYDCICDCGNNTIASADALRSGHKTTCGCKIGRSIGEEKIFQVLKENNIKFLNNVAFFKDLKTSGGGLGRYDFIILNEENKAIRLIEFDGIQHYQPTSFYNTHEKEHNFIYITENDRIKTQYAINNNIPLVRIPYWAVNKINIEMVMGDKYLITEVAD